ncbi:MAG TPA: DNA repair protein RadC [Acidobacteriota bacterium]|nr:DNA repair protein RadC [Acidobacteriota bacterium]HQG92497.1 DNA repair protein RadC [Acidobacteriota bacterium]HQK86658.1 DNA repair protein RadC [Acidobacteriota bacterium]
MAGAAKPGRAAEPAVTGGRDGHRVRLRERFLAGGPAALADYELLELLLQFAVPRKDTKPTARELLRRCGTLAGVFLQPRSGTADIAGLGPSSRLLLALVRAVMTRALAVELQSGCRISAPEDVADFVRLELGPQPRECVLAIFLNAGNELVHLDRLAEGTVNQAPVYPREVARLALLHGATGVILAHNHPGGQCVPSRDDLDLTRTLGDALAKLDVHLLDHLIVTPAGVYSITAGREVRGGASRRDAEHVPTISATAGPEMSR